MRRLDLTPLYRATVGFDQIADLMDRALASDVSQNSYPPYNIEKTEDDGWRISIAVAGFAEDDLAIEVRDRSLVVTARKSEDSDERTYLHRGIATRAFERRFTLADHVRVTLRPKRSTNKRDRASTLTRYAKKLPHLTLPEIRDLNA